MSSNGDASKPGNSHKSRHQVHRSISELSSPVRLHRHHSHHVRRRERQSDERMSLSAFPGPQPARSSLDLPRSDGFSPAITPSASRRASILNAVADDSRAALALSGTGLRKVSREEELHDERSKATSRAEGLKKSLIDLSVFSNDTTRRLDGAYYAVLEKLSVLQSTINAMKDLAVLAQETNQTLDKESQELVDDIQGQLDAMGNFDEQENRLKALQDRIVNGRAMIGKLSARVNVVRERIEGWEQADREWQERTRKRLKVIWIVISVVAFALVSVFFTAQYMEPILESTGLNATNASIPLLGRESAEHLASTRPNGSIPRGLTEREECASEDKVHVPSILKRRAHEEDRLRLFDEL